MEDGHLASPGCFFYRGFRWLRLFILNLILIGFFRPERGHLLPFGSQGISRHRSFLMGEGGKAGIGQGPVQTKSRPAPRAEVRLLRELLPAVMTELGDPRRLFRNLRFVDCFRDFRPPGRFGNFPRFGFNNRAPSAMFGNIPSERADLRLCKGFHRTFHGNFHGRLDFGFFHGRDIVTIRRGYPAFSISDNGNLCDKFRHLPDLGTPRGSNRLYFT